MVLLGVDLKKTRLFQSAKRFGTNMSPYLIWRCATREDYDPYRSVVVKFG